MQASLFRDPAACASRRLRVPAPGASAPRQPIGRRAAGTTATEAAAVFEDARPQQHIDRDREDLADDEATRRKPLSTPPVVTRSVTLDRGLQCFAVVGVGGRGADDRGQSVRVRQDVHPGIRPAPVHGARTCEFAPLFSPQVSGVEDHTRDVDEPGVI